MNHRVDVDISEVLDQADFAHDQLANETPRIVIDAVREQAKIERENHAFDNYTHRLEKSIAADVRVRRVGEVNVALVAGSTADDINGDGGSARYASIVEARGRMNMAERAFRADAAIARGLARQATKVTKY